MEKRRRTKAKRVLAVSMALLMMFSVIGYDGNITAYAQTGQTTYDIATGALTINSSNLSNYNNAVITGTSKSNMITIDGVSVNLTLSNLNLNIESDTATTAGWKSAIKLKNGASLNLTVTGDNTLSAGIEHAAINVPAGCSLVITKESTGILTAMAGGAAAGIGADFGGNYSNNIQTVGNITINGGTVKAYGKGVGAGIGGTMFGKTGNIVINGGTVYAKGGGGILSTAIYSGAGIGGGAYGFAENIRITGGTVTAEGGHYHSTLFKDAPGAGIGCGSSSGIRSDGKYTCGTISITGGAIMATGGNHNAVNAIGYGLSPEFDISGDNYTGSVTISDVASVNTNGGEINPLFNATNLNMYKLTMTIYDGRLTETIAGALVKINGKTYSSDLHVSENYVGNVSGTFVYPGVLTGEQTVQILADGYEWRATLKFKEGALDYAETIGSKLYPVYLKFYDMDITADRTNISLSVRQEGKELNANSSNGIVQMVSDGKISCEEENAGKLMVYLPAGGSTDITISGSGLNNGNVVSLVAQTIQESTSGTELTAWENAKKYNLNFTIYDGRLVKGTYPASITVGGKTVTKDILVGEDYVGTAACNVYLPLGTETKDVQITASSYVWQTTMTPSGNGGDTEVFLGTKLYPVYLWFYDTAIISDIQNASLSVTQEGKTLNKDASQGLVQLVFNSTITMQSKGLGKLTAYMPAGISTTLTTKVNHINSGSDITISNQSVKSSSDGTSIIAWEQESIGLMDLSKGSITFADNGSGGLNISYTTESGEVVAQKQYYQREYEIIQTESTATTNQIIFKNAKDVVNVKLNGVNMTSTGKAVDLQNSKVRISLSGMNTIDCQGGSVADAAYFVGIHAGSGTELIIDGNGSLEIMNPSFYGVGIGGYYNKESGISEGAGKICIQGGTIQVSGRNAAAIGSAYSYNGWDWGSINISGGSVTANNDWFMGGAAIGGSAYGKPSDVNITGGKVTAISNSYDGGSAIGSGNKGLYGGAILISGGYVEAVATSTNPYNAIAVAIGGGYMGVCPSIDVRGGTIKATGASVSIGRATLGAGGSLRITGGSISTSYNGKAAFNLTPSNGTAPVYYTTVDVSEIYGKDEFVNTASIKGSEYDFTDVKTDTNGILHLYLPASTEGTKASFTNINFSASINKSDGNIFKKLIPLAAEADAVSSTSATFKVTSEAESTVYYVVSPTELTTGSEVETANGVKSMTLTNGSGSAILSGLTVGSKNTCYLVAKIGNDYSEVVCVTFTTKEAIMTYAVTASAKAVIGESINAFISGVADYTSGANATVTASAVSGYNFVGWYPSSSEDPGYTGDILSKNRVYTFTVNKNTDIVAVYKPLETVTVTVDGGTSYAINGTEYTTPNTAAYPLGTMLTIAVSDATDFAYWTNNYGIVVSRNASYAFSVTGAMTLSAVYNTKVENQSTIIFESYYGQVMQRIQLGKEDMITLPDGPTRFGYSFAGWSMTEEQIKEQIAAGTKVIRVTPVYMLNEQSYMITVIGGTGSKSYKQNDVVTVMADVPTGGMKFSHWSDAMGNILSYNTTYTFYATSEATITANYVEETSVVEAKGTAEIVAVNKDTANSKISFVSMVTVPTGCSIQIAGVIGTNVEAVGTAGEGFNKDTALYVRGGAWSGSACRYTWTKKVVVGETWYVRAYLVYLDKNGNVVTVYGNMVSVLVTNE